MKLFQCPKVFTNEMEEPKVEGIEEEKDKLIGRNIANIANIVTKEAKEEIIKK